MVRETGMHKRRENRTGGERQGQKKGRKGWVSFGVGSPIILAHGELVFCVFIIGDVVVFELFGNVLCVGVGWRCWPVVGLRRGFASESVDL